MHKQYYVETPGDPQQIAPMLEERFYEHNSAIINKPDGAYFSRIVKDDDGKIIGGITGWTWAGSCEITSLWVRADCRNRGIGTLLLQAAEEEATNKRCSVILLRSYSFQSPQFYQKHGFAIEHVMDNFPVGFQHYTLVKKMQI